MKNFHRENTRIHEGTQIPVQNEKKYIANLQSAKISAIFMLNLYLFAF